MNLHVLYDHAMDHLRATAPHPEQMLRQWRDETPQGRTDRHLFEEYAWVVMCCGLTPQTMLKRWDRMGEAFLGWDPVLAAERRIPARTAALDVFKNGRKIDAVLDFAGDLARAPGQMERLAAKPLKEVLMWFGTLPWVGENNRYHLARNLGWDVAVRHGPVVRLAAYLGQTADELCAAMADQTGERVRTVDLLLWWWGHQVGDAHMKEMASLFRLM